ncbi:Two-component response regulator, SAPR family, consists of REC, wHTH and BTAD domains [Paenibacillus algorifonticola]|uniref:Two-component response regulator, SAPR family, consists of REC, wHTH and BTAD domains n=1 Tax=Paenibacillus algorifonticola TaxID=684063 RepID=A0A1I2BHL0_9BACL|nr:response regulator [Paenibacillus algorifonticola]SFE54670.1 Two-component response regulator, SAPR family, consists of REC, wHTH and BTAD domains [Paenibacillus algorifonticola]
MYKVIIVEDEKPILDLMKFLIGQSPDYMILGAFTNPLEALASLSKLQPDAIFIDVEMPKMNGLELAQRINEITDQTKIIFTTAYKEYALEAFHVQAFDYIMKPVTRDAIERIASRLHKQYNPAVLSEQRVKRSSIRCFGGLDVRNSKGLSVHWPTRKTEELCAYFLCHPGMDISKWYLANLLWPDLDEVRSSHNLHNAVYLLKKILKEQGIGVDIRRVNDGYMLDPGELVYDVLEFENHFESKSGSTKAAAQEEHLVSLYKGPLLDRKDYVWKAPIEESYSKKYVLMMRALIERDMAAQHWEKAERRLENYLSVYALDEEMNLLLLQVYENGGKEELVIKHYAQFKKAYQLEMGIEPPSEMEKWMKARVG